MNDPTKITWLTLPRNGNGGAALVDWGNTTFDTIDASGFDYPLRRHAIGYLLGASSPRYPMPVVVDRRHPGYWLYEYDFFF